MNKSPASTRRTSLTAELAREWREPSNSATQPVILLEQVGPHGIQHVYVVWDGWSDLPQVERSEIIMDAAEEALGAPAVLNITVAMGLTAAEADRMGIEYR